MSIYIDFGDIRRFVTSTYVDLCRVLSMSVEVADGGGPCIGESGIGVCVFPPVTEI